MIMKCYRCGKGMNDGVEQLTPIDPKGTKDRRWVCDKCVTEKEYDSVPDDVREIIDNIIFDNRRKTAYAMRTMMDTLKKMKGERQ